MRAMTRRELLSSDALLKLHFSRVRKDRLRQKPTLQQPL